LKIQETTVIKFSVEDGNVTAWRETFLREEFGTKPYAGDTSPEGIEKYRKVLEDYFKEPVEAV
jgi:hypothetical protein